MNINIRVQVKKKLFDYGYVVEPTSKADFKSALLLLNTQKSDDKYLISKDIVGADIGGIFHLTNKNEKYQLYLNELKFMSLMQESGQLKIAVEAKKDKNRYLAAKGTVIVGDTSSYKKRKVKVISVGKPFYLKQKLADIPDWLFEKLYNLEVHWIYFEHLESDEKSNSNDLKEIRNLKDEIINCVQYLKQHGDKTRKKQLIQSEAPGNVNLQRFCDLRRIDSNLKVFFVISNNYIWLLEQNRNDPLPNVKLNSINFGGWIVSNSSNEHLIVKLRLLDRLLKESPDLYASGVIAH